MFPKGSIFFPLIVALLKMCFFLIEPFFFVQKLIFDDTDTNILKVCVFLIAYSIAF